MVDLFDIFETAFIRNEEGRLFYVRGWRHGFEVTDDERRRLTQILSPMYTCHLMLIMGIVALNDEFAALLGVDSLLFILVAGIPSVLLVLLCEKVVRRCYLGARAKVATGVKFDPRRSPESGRFVRMLLILLGSMFLAKAMWYQNAFKALFSLACLAAAAFMAWRHLPTGMQEK
ncbi:hypothetical protein [Kordiimonas sp.]|uniref:hypothetical protein n=1 Tax=Kordiimonas sp. TaxID=1970157 RepID=UPI003A8CF5C7